MKEIAIDKWKRKEYYEFFTPFDNPFFGLVTEVDCTTAKEKCKTNGYSLFAYYLHQSIRAVNKVEELKFRRIDEKIIQFDTIHASATLGRSDGSFGFSFMPFDESYENFREHLNKEIKEVNESIGIRANEDAYRRDVIHYSVLPWNNFSSLSHARNFNTDDSIPKISFGKAMNKNGRFMLPISIEVHHGFADGYHVSEYLRIFQDLLNE